MIEANQTLTYAPLTANNDEYHNELYNQFAPNDSNTRHKHGT